MSRQGDILILYGSQTGNAEGMSQELFQNLSLLTKRHIFRKSLNEWRTQADKSSWEQVINSTAFIIIICSSTGNGEFPDNAERFWRFIKSRKLSKGFFNDISFGVCALGDTNYSQFCNAGKNLHKRLTELGGNCLIPLHCIDEVEDLEEQFGIWNKNICKIVEEAYRDN
tara:strand:- start:8 stop:514 length:507 start_codon:yes stop_codon:yes gene_type:complete